MERLLTELWELSGEDPELTMALAAAAVQYNWNRLEYYISCSPEWKSRLKRKKKVYCHEDNDVDLWGSDVDWSILWREEE